MEVDASSRELVREIVLRGPVSKTDLAARTNLSKPSLTRLLKNALESGLIVETGEHGNGKRGRPARPLELNPSAGYTFGVKLTGTAGTVVATDLACRTLAETTIPLASTDPTAVAATVGATMSAMRHEVREAGPLLGAGVGVAGSVYPDGVVHQATFLGWSVVDFGGMLEKEFGAPVVVENDVVALTTYEHWFGVARGLEHFAVVTIGTGVGHGLVVNDRVVSTLDAGMGLAGHIPLDSSGPFCHLGHRGCSGALLTLDSLAEQFTLSQRRPQTFQTLLDAFAHGDPAAKAIVGQAGDALGKLIALAANLGACSTVVLAGEASGIWDAARPEAERSLRDWRNPAATPVDVRVERAGFTVWSAGAAALAVQAAFGPTA